MRRNRRNLSDEQEAKRMFLIAGGVLLVAIVAFVVTFIVYSNVITDEEESAKTKITELAMTNQITTSEASSSIGKTVNEVEQESNKVADSNTKNEGELSENLVNKIAVNTSVQETKKENTIVNTVQETQTTAEAESKEEETIEDPTFIMPVEGEISKIFAKDNLVYSETLKEWVTHNGIDIKADKTTVVKASAKGTVQSIKNDPRYGITVVIEHNNGFKTIYANLLTAEFVKEGETVKQGQTIGTVGNTATFEIAEDPHLHFEILKDNEYLDPNLYLK